VLRLSVSEVQEATGGRLKSGDNHTVVEGVAVDSRRVRPGQLFVALKGEKFDGHDYAAEAVAAGAAAVVVEREVDVGPGVPVVQVDSTTDALMDLAAYHRSRFNPTVIAVTGSIGKTTTKDMVASILSQHYRTLKNRGNYNTEIGLPLTMFDLDESHEMAVLEMGMRGPAQIAALARVARPSIGIVTNVAPVHVELLGSVRNVARAKRELVESIPCHGTCVLNGDDRLVRSMAARCRGKTLIFGGRDADIWADGVEDLGRRGVRFRLHWRDQERVVLLPLPGVHNISNALGAAGASLAAGACMDMVQSGLARLELSGMRLEIQELPRGITVLNDAYNANPVSMKAALRVLKRLGAGQRRIAVLGDMLELGSDAVKFHVRVGWLAAEGVADILISVGELGKAIAEGARMKGMSDKQVYACRDTVEAGRLLQKLVCSGDVILLKASRAVRLEKAIDYLPDRRS